MSSKYYFYFKMSSPEFGFHILHYEVSSKSERTKLFSFLVENFKRWSEVFKPWKSMFSHKVHPATYFDICRGLQIIYIGSEVKKLPHSGVGKTNSIIYLYNTFSHSIWTEFFCIGIGSTICIFNSKKFCLIRLTIYICVRENKFKGLIFGIVL